MDLKFIICYIGNGVFLMVIKNGVSIDIIMGFIFLEGLMMGVWSGFIDLVILFFL